MITQRQLDEAIKTFAQGVSGSSIGLVAHRPEPWASPMHCFENMLRKIASDGGNGIDGRYFLHRTCAFDTSLDYVIAVHHVVWQGADGGLVDITPHHADPKARPYQPGKDYVLFLCDPAARPVVRGPIVAPMPSQFIPIGDSHRLRSYLLELARDEQQKCERIYNGELPVGAAMPIN